MVATDEQIWKLRDEMTRHGKLSVAALRAGLSCNTARKYLRLDQLPSECRQQRSWRTREDPFELDWPAVTEQLADAPGLEAKILFERLLEQHPERYHEGQLRTFQRRVREWRARHGPPREVFFPQEHRAGEAAQSDFTNANELGVTIEGEAFPHLLFHLMLPHSRWEWATTAKSESLAALKRGVQTAIFQLGRVPRFHQTDCSTAATHDVPSAKRAFNEDYLALMEHFGMTPRTIVPGAKEQNGSVEAMNRALKRRLEQELLLRGSRDFASMAAYESWIACVLRKLNRRRQEKLAAELAVMGPLPVRRLREWKPVDVVVTSWSTVRVQRNAYSVPSRLIGERVRARVHDDRIEVYHGEQLQLVTERLLGTGHQRIDYRHIIASLVRKPGAFARYRYREELFPSLVFRKAYDALAKRLREDRADVEYVRILYRAARTMESEVEVVLEQLLDAGELPLADTLKAAIEPEPNPVPAIAAPEVDLVGYDELLGEPDELRRLVEVRS